MWRLGLSIAFWLVVSLSIGVAAEVNKEVEQAEQQIESLRQQYTGQKAVLDDLASRGAPYEVLRYYEFRCRGTQEKIAALEAAVEGWQAAAAGNEVRAKKWLRKYEAFNKSQARRTALREYGQNYQIAKTAKEQAPRGQAWEAIAEIERGWDKAFTTEARRIARAYVEMRAAQSAFDPVEFARLMVRRRVVEDRINVLDRALYHLDSLKGGYIPNPDFDSQYDDLWRRLLGTSAQNAVESLSSTVSAARCIIHLTGEKLGEARHAFMLSYFEAELATATMELGQLAAVAAGVQRGCALLSELEETLDALEAQIEPLLTTLGYDARLEARRPIKFDKAGNPSDVVFILDARAGEYMHVLEGDATQGHRPPLPTDAQGNITLEPSTGSPPDVSKGELYQTYLVNLYNHHNNLGLPTSFWEEATEEMLARNVAGDTANRTVNIWHPRVREVTEQYFQAVGRFLRSEPRFLLYDHVTWEPKFRVPPKERDSPFFGYAVQPGRSEIAVRAFRNWLKDKFNTIEKLNKAWGSDYEHFELIDPPPDPFIERRRRASALTYEHERFLGESLANYIALACGSIMRGDPDHPVIFEMPGMMDYAMEGCFANVPLLSRVPAQMVEMHKNTFWPALPVQVYAATVIPMYGKIPVHTEFMWNWARRATPSDENEVYYQGLQTIWRNIAHGIRVLFPFSHYNWPGYENAYADWLISKNWQPGRRSRTGPILRDSIASLAVGARRARRFGELLRDTVLAPREVGIIQPSTSTTNAYPYYSISWSFNVHVIESKNFHDLLFNKNYQYGYVPEEAFYDGHAQMDDYRVLILPYAPYFPDGFTEKLLGYLRRGEVLIASGVPGLYDKYGRDDGSFIKEVFGEMEVAYSGDDYNWQFDIRPVRLKPGRRVLVRDNDQALLIRARYGRGSALISALPFGQWQRSHRLVPHFYGAVDDALSSQFVKCTYDRFEVLVRQRGERYFLFICNYSLCHTREDLITVKGEHASLVDHGISPRFQFLPLPRKHRESLKMPADRGVFYFEGHSPPGLTCFWLRLAPGEGTVIELVP